MGNREGLCMGVRVCGGVYTRVCEREIERWRIRVCACINMCKC